MNNKQAKSIINSLDLDVRLAILKLNSNQDATKEILAIVANADRLKHG